MEKDKNIIDNINAIIFDFDGTLYDMRHFAYYLILHNLTDLKLLKRERKVRRIIRNYSFSNREEYYSAFFKMLFPNNNNIDEAYKWYFEKYMKSFIKALSRHVSARKNVSQIFDKLSEKNIKMAILSDYPFAKERLKAIKIDSNIDCYCSEDFGALKPNPQALLKLADNMNVKAENVLVVGDKFLTDGKAAINANMKYLIISPEDNLVEKNISWDSFCNLIFEKL